MSKGCSVQPDSAKIQGGAAMRLQVKASILQEALGNLIEIRGLTQDEISLASGAHNISRIVNGSTVPTAPTWQKLHKAYPKEIPSVVFTDGKVDFHQVTSGNRVVSTGNNNRLAGNDYNENVSLSAGERMLIDLLRDKDKASVILRKFLKELLDG